MPVPNLFGHYDLALLPEAELGLVEREKVLDYLLNRAHRYGASKVRWFSEVEG